MSEDKIIIMLKKFIPHDLAPFEFNGLVTKKSKKQISKIGVTLGLSKKSILEAKRRNINFLIIHNAPEVLENPYYKKLKFLAEDNKISLYRLHLPLDFMKGGLINTLCSLLDLNGVSTHIIYKRSSIQGGVYMANKKLSLHDLIRNILAIHPSTIRIVRGGRKIKKIAITTGDGCKPEFLLQLNPDVFICGLFNQEAIRLANDLDITLIEATSYATENEPLKSITLKLEKLFSDLSVEFIDIKNDVEAVGIT